MSKEITHFDTPVQALEYIEYFVTLAERYQDERKHEFELACDTIRRALDKRNHDDSLDAILYGLMSPEFKKAINPLYKEKVEETVTITGIMGQQRIRDFVKHKEGPVPVTVKYSDSEDEWRGTIGKLRDVGWMQDYIIDHVDMATREEDGYPHRHRYIVYLI